MKLNATVNILLLRQAYRCNQHDCITDFCALNVHCCFCAGDFFMCLNRCMDEFSGQNIEIACEMVEIAGAFMLRQAETAPRMEHVLNVRLPFDSGPPIYVQLSLC
jgi:hypothetical protein